MAYPPIQLKRSNVPGHVPTAGDLISGELAVNTADGKLYTKRDSGEVVEIGTGSGGEGLTLAQVQATALLF